MPEDTKIALNAGELSDELAGRIDLKKFNVGCEVLENARVLRAGGVTRRAGFEHVGSVADNTQLTRLVGFRFSSGQGVVLELCNLSMRIIRDGVIEPTVYTTPWAGDQVFDLQFAQRVDRIIVTHPDVKVHNILRYNDGTWAVQEYPWQTRVWEPYPSTTDFVLTPSATTGTGITIDSSSPLFPASPSWVGDRIRIDHTVGETLANYEPSDLGLQYAYYWTGYLSVPPSSLLVLPGPIGDYNYKIRRNMGTYHFDWWEVIQAWSYADDYVSGKNDMSDYPEHFARTLEVVPATVVGTGWSFETTGTWKGQYWVQRSYNNGVTWGTVKAIHSDFDRNELVTETETQPALIRVILVTSQSDTRTLKFTVGAHSVSGSALVTARNSDTQVVATVEEDFHSTDASTTWFEEAFSPRNGYPAGVTFYQSRLCFGGTATRPQTIWLSRSQATFDFTFGTLATDGMSFETDAEGYESIAWLSSHLHLLVGTSLGVWAISSPDGKSLSPESNNIKRQMQLGAQGGFQAVPIQSNVLFLQHKGRKIQELTSGSVEYGGYRAADLTQLATHVTRKGVTQLATGELPDSSLFMVNGGEISVLTYERGQNVVGWARWVTDGAIESIAVTSGAEEEDDHYFVVNRDGVRSIERLAPDMLRVEEDNDVANLRFLDNYTERVDSGGFTTITGLSRFNGMEVDSFADGEPAGAITVTGGVADFGRTVYNAVVGLPYTTEVRPMSMDFGAIGSKSAMNEVMIRFRNSLGGETSQDRTNWSAIEQLIPRTTDGTPAPLVSDDYKSTLHSTWQRNPSISVRQAQPLPMTILAMRVKTKSSK